MYPYYARTAHLRVAESSERLENAVSVTEKQPGIIQNSIAITYRLLKLQAISKLASNAG